MGAMASQIILETCKLLIVPWPVILLELASGAKEAHKSFELSADLRMSQLQEKFRAWSKQGF